MQRASTYAPTISKTASGIAWAGCLLAVALSSSTLAAATEAPEAGQRAEASAKVQAAAPKIEAAAKGEAAPDKPAAAAVDAAPVKPAGEPAVVAREPPMTEAQASVRKYCMNIAAAATDARFSWQSKKLLEVETRIKARIAELDSKQAELKAWFDRREQIAKAAKENLVGIYSKMKPETAAAQIGALNDDTAAAVLAALTPRQASAIFDEMTPPDRAAKLAGLLGNPLASANEKKL